MVARPEGDGVGDDPKLEHERLKLLFDYTKFHIGLYSTLATLVLVALGLKNKGWDLDFVPALLWVSVFSMGLAGLAGGIIAGSVPQRAGFSEFWTTRTGPY